MFVYFCLTSKIPEGNHQQLTTPQQIPTKDPMKNLMKFPAGLAKGPREEVTGRRLRGGHLGPGFDLQPPEGTTH